MNCEVFASTEFFAHCSHAPFYGIETGKSGLGAIQTIRETFL
jgi:hypothetical protein